MRKAGYLHPGYAESFVEFGRPRELPRCGGWILERPIPGFLHRDAMGCYPLFACQDWSQLHLDLEDLGGELVSLSLVTDPFGAFDPSYLRKCFDVVKPFKEHYIADLNQPIDIIISKRHRYKARKALKGLQVEKCPDPTRFLDEWMELYSTLIERHQITGIRAFSHQAFAKQLSIPGMIMFRAVKDGITIGANLIYLQGDVAYTHLSAFNQHGYDLRASYAIRWEVINYLIANKVRWLNLGAGAGLKNKDTGGLSHFKRGWSTGTRTAYLCGRIFDSHRYSELVKAKGIQTVDYLPAYRQGEFQ